MKLTDQDLSILLSIHKITERTCKSCLKNGMIVAIQPFSTNLHVYRKCATEKCENNFDHNNGKYWCEVKPYKDYSSTELREILEWVDKAPPNQFHDGKKVVIEWHPKQAWRFQRLDQNNDNNPKDFMPIREYALKRIREVLEQADARVGKLPGS